MHGSAAADAAADEIARAYRVRMWVGVFALSAGFWFAIGLGIRALLT